MVWDHILNITSSLRVTELQLEDSAAVAVRSLSRTEGLVKAMEEKGNIKTRNKANTEK